MQYQIHSSYLKIQIIDDKQDLPGIDFNANQCKLLNQPAGGIRIKN